MSNWGFFGGTAVKSSCASRGDLGSISRLEIPWRRKWQPTPVILPRKPHGQSSLVGYSLSSVQFSSVAQSCLTLCDCMDSSTPGIPVHYQLSEFTQIHVHWVSDAIQPSYPLSSPSPPAYNLSQHQGLFKWVSCPHQVAKILEFQLQYQSLQWTPLGWTGWISLQSKGLSRVFSNTIVQKHQRIIKLKNQKGGLSLVTLPYLFV